MRKNRGLPVSCILTALTALAAAIFSLVPDARADAPSTSLQLRYTGTDFEGRQSIQLQWSALSNSTYLVQFTTDLTAPVAWKTVDIVTPTNGVGQYEIKGRSIPENSAQFFRLVLPQPQVFSVEPAIVAPGAPVTLYVFGQCFDTNMVLQINGVTQASAVLESSSRITVPSFTPDVPGTYEVRLVSGGVAISSFNVICADAVANPELVLQGPPTLTPAAPVSLMKAKEKANRTKCANNLRTSDGGDETDEDCGNFSGTLFVPALMKAKEKANQVKCGNLRPAGGGGGSGGSLYDGRADLLDCFDDPIALMDFSGEVCAQVVDLAVEGRGLDFIWARTYHSRIGRTGTATNGWTFSYDINIQPLDGNILVHDGTGRADTYWPDTNGIYTCPEFFREGTLSNNVFTLTFADTGYWEFNPLTGSSAAGKLSKIVDRNGNTASLNYDFSGRLAEVVDDLGRTNSIGYDSAGRLGGVTDFSGRTVTYQYYQGLPADQGGPGDLASVTSPSVTGTPNGNDFPTGKTTSYTYTRKFPPSLERQNHLLLSCVDALGQTTSQFNYDFSSSSSSYLCCASMQRWTNSPTIVTYLAQTPSSANRFATRRCIINDPVGNVTECFYDARGRCVTLDEFTGRATPGSPVTDTVNRPVGKLRDSDPGFYECRAAWNNDSLCTRLYLFGGQGVQCVYQSDFDKTTSARKRADLCVVGETASSAVDLDGDGASDITQRVSYLEHDPRFGSDPTPLGVAGVGMGKGMYDWIQHSFDKSYARGPRQTVSLDGIFNSNLGNDRFGRPAVNTARYKGWDGTIKGLVVPAGNGMAINRKGTGADANRGMSVPLGNGVAINVKGTGADKGRVIGAPLGNGVAINVKGTGADKGRALHVPDGDDADGDLWPDATQFFVTSVTDPRGNVTTAEFDSKGNRVKVKFPWLPSSEEGFAYNAYGQLSAVTNSTDANGYARVDTFDYYTNGPQAGYLRSIIIDDRNLLGLKLTCTFECDTRGNLTRYVDPQTNDWLYTFNALDQCVRVQSPTNIISRCATDLYYDANDNLVQCTTELRNAADNFLTGKTDHFRCDPLHRVTRIECALDATRSMTNDFVYDGNDECVLALSGDAVSGADSHQAISFQYDERGLLFRETGGPGSSIQTTTQWDYDANGNPVRVSVGLEDSPSITTMEYDGFAGLDGGAPGERIRVHEGLAPRVSASAPAAELARFVRKARVWILAGAPNNRISKTTDPMGNVTTFNYDANDNLKVIRHFGETNDVAGTNANIRLAESHYNYDALDRCVASHDFFFDLSTQAPIGDGECTTTFAYAPNGECTSITDDLGHVTTFTYDTVGWPATRTTPQLRTEFAVLRNRRGNVVSGSQTDISDLVGPPEVFAWTNVYDSLSRCVRITDNVGNSSHCTYDSLGRIEVMFNPREYSARYSYDLLGRCTLAVADLDGDGVLDVAHDISSSNYWSSSSGQLLATTDSHGNTTSYAYDSLNRCTQVTRPDTTRMSLVWSPRSNLIQETDPDGTVILHAYDSNDRCISNYITPGAGVSSATTSEQFVFDGCSRVVSALNDTSVCTFTYDSLGRCTRGNSGGIGALTTYDSVGNRLSLTYPGGRSLTYGYDSQDRCTNIFEKGASFIGFDYDGPDRLARIRCANGVNSRIFYDGILGTQNSPGDFGQGEISAMRHAVAGGTPELDRLSMFWDPNGNKALRIHIINGSGPTNGIAMSYDAADRLIEGRTSGNFGFLRDTHYNLDQAGNRTNVTGGVTCSGDYGLSSTIPPADYQMNQFTTTACDSRTYDDNGNLIGRSTGAVSSVTYTYDCYDRLVNVNDSGLPIAIYAYDALGRRISKTVFTNDGQPPVTTQFYYDGDSVIEERSGGVVTATYVRPRRFGIGDTLPQCPAMRRNGKDYFIHTDDQGNALTLTTSGGAVVERYDYDDYGDVSFMTSDGISTSATSSSVGNPYLFHGMEWDAETALYHDHGMAGNNPFYEPKSGRVNGGMVKAIRDWGNGFTANNPWSGGGGGGGGVLAIEPRDSLKTYFQTGDVPTPSQRLSRNILKSFFQTDDKPSQAQ